MSESPITPTAVLPPLPWFLGEPPTYPAAATLLEVARTILLAVNLDEHMPLACRPLDDGPLLIYAWYERSMAPHVQGGLGIWWQGRLVLLATGDGEVWAYHAGSAWEEALHALAVYGRTSEGATRQWKE